MYYSFDFAANITYLCIEEIRSRGLQERKIFRKSLPNSGLFIKAFNKQTCKREDLEHVDIHSVATLMQDALWSSQERIISKKAWRAINYETCTLSKLSSVISSQSEQFLIDILDFLVQIMHYKEKNLMDAYKLGDALGKVVLGPSDCGPIMAEKAGHFLTRMIIEHAKIQHQRNFKKPVRRIDSGFDSSYSCHSFYNEHDPLCKAQGTRARAKFYNRDIKKTRWMTFDWCDNAIGVRAMLDNEYEKSSEPPRNSWISIFTAADLLLLKPDVATSPLLFRILREAIKPVPSVSSDPFETSYLFNQSKAYWTERQIHEAFNEFYPQIDRQYHYLDADDRYNNPLKKLNHSLSHLKLNIKKYRSRHDLLNDSDDTDDHSSFNEEKETPKINDSMISVMKKMIKFGGISQKNNSSNLVI